LGEAALLDIHNKWALVTGASRGVGRQVSQALADNGCNLVLHSRQADHTAAMVAEFRARGLTVYPIEGELSDQRQVVALGEEALRISGGLDILYSNAAVMAPYHEDIFVVEESEYALSFQVNTIAPITLCTLVLPGMIERKFGRVVNVTSGIKDQPQLMAYAASKAALDKYVYDMAPHLANTGVTMNLLDPGWLRTDLGGPAAPNSVESVLPGAMVPVLLEDGTCGKWFSAQDYR
jgi:NAD(P)-dependent dehydrogenase (short-subunit alcohol dehydrogenase family)